MVWIHRDCVLVVKQIQTFSEVELVCVKVSVPCFTSVIIACLFILFSDHYSSEPFIRNDAVAYASGEVVVAKFTEDDTFYRARVVDSDFDNHQVKVRNI